MSDETRLYCVVPEARVNPLTVAMAHTTLKAVKAELGLYAEIELRWFGEYGTPAAAGVQLKDTFTQMEMGGFTGGSEDWQGGFKTIWINAAKTPRAAVETVAHEVCHVHQFHKYGDYSRREDRAYHERWARDFGAEWARKTTTDADLRGETQRLNRLTEAVLRKPTGGGTQSPSQWELEQKWLQARRESLRAAGMSAGGATKVFFPHSGGY